MFKKTRWATALVAFLASGMAHSQDTPPPETPVDAATQGAAPEAPVDAATGSTAPEAKETARGGLLEEIVVTAQKREENLADVPISIQAFSPEALSARGIESQLGLSRAVPSLDVGSQAGYATIFLRGIGTEAFLTADPSIASYVDGVYFPFSPTFVQDFAGVERVEVLKGPQGTLFGRNATGGAISVTSRAPDFEEALTTFDVTMGSDNLIKPRVYSNVPITENFAVNLSAYYSKADYYLDGESQGKPLRDQIDRGVRFKARWAPADFLDLNLAWTRTRNQGNGPIGQNLNPSPLGRLALINAPEDKETVNVDERLYGVADTRLVSGQINFYLPWLDVKLLASDQLNSLLYNYDFDGSPLPYVSFDVPGHPANIQQGEIQLISNESQPFAEWLDVTGGVFFFQNTQGFDPVEVTVGNIAATNDLRQDFLDELSGLGIDIPALDTFLGATRLYRARAQAQVYTESIGYYLQLTTRFNDYVALTLGGRYQDEERGLYRSTVTVVFGDAEFNLPNGEPPVVFTNARDEDNRTVPAKDTTKGFYPKVTLDVHPFGDDTLLFASYQEAEKAHAYNAFAVYALPQYIRSEEITAYEVGLRTTLLDGAMRLSAAAFQYDIDDLQTQYVSLLSGGALAFENAPKATSKGIDFDLVAEIFPDSIEGLALSLNGAYIDATFGSYPEAAGYNPDTGLFSANNDFSGNRQTRTPEYSGTVAFTKLWGLDNGEFEIGSDYYYNDGFFYSASNDSNYEQKSYSLVGAFVRYRYEPWKLGVRAFGNNLTDEFYTQGVISTDFGGVFTVAPPATYGVTLSLEF
ncbi:MAG: TonB-dependent receptor [Panacagrimonas sp.]